uniref:Beta/gamma crystallin 'Greek key' domain-containing protein n=1 Tax=Acrobeloides nanus TaxID=290746 RepID=A0A914D9R5_9BILA
MSEWRVWIFLLVASTTLIHISDARGFTLWENSDFDGESREMQCTDFECHNFDSFNDAASSINTQGGCVALFEHGNCGGRRVIFKPGCELGECCKHSNFESCGFNDQASSFACC